MHRNSLVESLERDLIGVGDGQDLIADNPSDRFLTGMLFPLQSRIGAENDDELAAGEGEEHEFGSGDGAPPLCEAMRPASAGLSFVVDTGGLIEATFTAKITAVRYELAEQQEDGEESKKEKTKKSSKRRANSLWKRIDPGLVELNLSCKDNADFEDRVGDEKYPGLWYYLRAARTGRSLAVTLVLINRNPASETRTENEEATWFQVSMSVEPSGKTTFPGREPLELSPDEDHKAAALIYRNVREFAVGHTCSASWEASSKSGLAELIRTEWMPRQEVPAMSTAGAAELQTLEKDGHKPLVADWLASAPRDRLCGGLRLLTDAYGVWIEKQTKRIADLDPRFRPAAETQRAAWCEARDRMLAGVSLLETNTEVFEAFRMSNRAMAMQAAWSGRSKRGLVWRPFQLAFQLMVLSSLADRSGPDRSKLDLLWFPTGGGKTEAYLGLVAFVLFLRRLRSGDKGAGVCAIMRYTLRVLTTQQFQRAAALICACEVVRKGSDENLGSKPFSIGLWIGSGAIPNKVAEARSDSEGRARQMRICPCCGGRIGLGPDVGRYEIRCCGEAPCELREAAPILPVWTVDEDIYRELPSLLIGTIDKFAQITRNSDTSGFFGVVGRCEPPDLIIQDELHLISGPLGSMAGLYESAIDLVCSERGHTPKIIGSTATIKRASVQVRQLFDRGVFQFPPSGLDADDSCFAVADRTVPGRLYLGITTAGRSAKFTLQAVCGCLLQAAGNDNVPESLRDDYWTLVAYFNSLRELGGAHVMMLDDVPKSCANYAARVAQPPRQIEEPAELTSRLSQAEIPEVLERLGCSFKDGAPDVLLSTNMISVGVDVPRLAMMVVNGQPKSTAEYIQATSRVGRAAVPGVIVTVFNAGKPRDRSRYETFSTWHQCLYRDVEPSSVTPFAPRAVDKAARAVVAAIAKHLVPGMSDSPVLDPAKREKLASLLDFVFRRVDDLDPEETGHVQNFIETMLDAWERKVTLGCYWSDVHLDMRRPLLISAEKHAALKAAGRERRDIWPAPNSMRDVEPSTAFQLD